MYKKSNYNPLSTKEEEIAKAVVNGAFKVHSTLGPGLLEKVYEVCLAHELKQLGYKVARQVDIPITYHDFTFEEGLRLDLLIEGLVICELKAVDEVNPVWEAQVLSHLKLTKLRLGFLINFNVTLIKDGIKRYVL